jgi:hypothetical protein
VFEPGRAEQGFAETEDRAATPPVFVELPPEDNLYARVDVMMTPQAKAIGVFQNLNARPLATMLGGDHR